MKKRKKFKQLWVIFILLGGVFQSAEASTLVLSPDAVIDRVLEKNLQAKRVRLDAERAKLAVGQANGIFDWTLNSAYSYTVDRAESFSSFENPEDRYTEWRLGVSKKLPTGTTLGIEFSRLSQSSTLSPLSVSFNTEADQTKDELSFTLKQELVKNAFGIVDRYQVHTAELGEQSAHLESVEQIENLVLQSLTRYWQAYAAKERISDARRAKSKYESLIRNLKRKRRLGVASVAELKRAEAEYWSQERNIINSTIRFENLKSELLEDIQMNPEVELQFSVIVDLPPIPASREPEADSSRAIQAAAKIVERRSWEKRAADLQTLPALNLVASYSLTGVEPQSSDAFSDLWSGNHPSYVVGLELTWLFASNLYRAEKSFAEVQFIDADTEVQQRRINLQQAWRRVRLEVEQSHKLALASSKELEFRQATIRDQEQSFRQGRIDSSQLIIDYNALYRAQSEKTEAIGVYRVALAKLAAIEDRLVPTLND